MKKFLQRKLALILGIFLIALGAFFLYGDYVAGFLWQKYQTPFSLLFIRHNAVLASTIGSYYFDASRGHYDLRLAESAYKKTISIDPKILWGHYQLARIYFVEGHSEIALQEINKELEANPENKRSLYVRGLIYGYSDKLQEAENDFRAFTQWSPKEWAGYNDLAWILLKEQKYDEVEKVVNKAFNEVYQGNNNPWLWNSLGVAQLNLKEYKAAEKSFTKAGELATKLTEEDWHRSYPGNDPNQTTGGLKAFREAIKENLQQARARQ